jgi:hypothetical protein
MYTKLLLVAGVAGVAVYVHASTAERSKFERKGGI